MHHFNAVLLLGLLIASLVAGEPGPADYPCWRGPMGNGSALASGRTLIPDIAQAKLLWTSDPLPGVYGAFLHTGNNGPLVAEGKVVVLYYEPNAESGYDETKVKNVIESAKFKAGDYLLDGRYNEAVKDSEKMAAYVRQRYAIAADDVALCLDAATGKVAWKHRAPNAVFNVHNASGRGTTTAKASSHNHPLIADGRLYALGGSHVLRCLDLKDGAVQWEAAMPGAGSMKKVIEQAAAAKSILALPREVRAPDIYFAIAKAGGLLQVKYNAALLGVDPTDGKVLWTAANCFSGSKSNQAPLIWRYSGGELVLAGQNAVDPRTGTVAWSLPDPASAEGPAGLAGDLLITPISSGDSKAMTLAAYRLSGSGATKVWTFPLAAPYGGLSSNAGVTVCGEVLMTKMHRTDAQTSDFLLISVKEGKLLAASGGARSPCNAGVAGDGWFFFEIGRDAASGIARFPIDPVRFGSGSGKPLGADGRNQPEVPYQDTLLFAGYAMSTAPVYADGRLYARMQNGIRCYDLRQP